MSNVIDELKVVFSADTGPLMAGLVEISQKLGEMQGTSVAAEASLRALSEAFAGGLTGLAGDAYSAGAGAGAAFAQGLRSQVSSVRSAAAYISASAVSSMGGRYTGSPDTGGTADNSGSVSSATRFDTSILSGGTGAAVSGSARDIEVTVPLNVDGVKLGEACIRAMDIVSGMTGRAHIAI